MDCLMENQLMKIRMNNFEFGSLLLFYDIAWESVFSLVSMMINYDV